MKLSKNQNRVIELMNDGWELGSSLSTIGHTRLVERAWLQENGLGKGGKTEEVSILTVKSLVRKNLIEQIDNPYTMSQTTRYKLKKRKSKKLNKHER